MLTLTVDPKTVSSPQEAWKRVTTGKLIARLTKRLGVTLWVSVLEFHKSGFPHWHLLIDLGTCPNGRIDLEKAWHLWRDKYNCGRLNLKHKQTHPDNALHGINYITVYLTKYPSDGFPEWWLDQHSGKMITACRKLGRIVGKERFTISPIIGR